MPEILLCPSLPDIYPLTWEEGSDLKWLQAVAVAVVDCLSGIFKMIYRGGEICENEVRIVS